MSDADRPRRPGAPWVPHSPGVAPQQAGTPAPPLPAPSVIAVCSGKGGVGKSTVALNLAVALAVGGDRVGLLDADVHAPDIPLMVGLARHRPSSSWVLSRPGGFVGTPLEPVERYGVQLMSSGFIIAEDQALTWTAGLAEALLAQLVWSTRWGPLDHLVVDLPPGTSHLVQALFRLVPSARAVLVVTPQDAAHLDTRRVLTALRAADVGVLGAVENMSGLRCPHCRLEVEVFPQVDPERSLWACGVDKLAVVPLTAAGSDDGPEPVVATAPDSPRGTALRSLACSVRRAVERPGSAEA
jgi:ATP-binding protein involved in chromosome partitioning